MASRLFTATQGQSRPFARLDLLAIGREAYFSFAPVSGLVEADEDFAEKLDFILGEDTGPKGVLERIHAQDKSGVDALLCEIEAGARLSGEVQFRVACSDGELRWLRLRAARAPAEPTNALRLIGSFANIHAEKEREASIELSARRQDDLLRQIEVMRAQLSYVLEVVESQRVWVWDLESGASGLLQGLAQLLGLNQRTELSSLEALQERVYAEDWPIVRDGLSRLWQEEAQPISLDYRVRSKEGGWQWVRTRGGLWRRGEISGVVCAGTHAIVTGEREARARRDRESALFTAFLESAPAAVAMFDKDLRYVYASQRWCTDYGLDSRNLIGRSHYEVFPEIDDEWKAIYQRCLQGAVEAREVDRFERANGKVQYLRWIVRPWHMSDGSIGGIIMLTEEITDRQRRAAEIAEDQERLNAALAIADAAVWEYDLTTERFYGSERLAELAGCDHVDASWVRDFVSTLHPDHVEEFRAAAERFWSGAVDRVAIDVSVRKANGGYRWLRSYISAMGDRSSGRLIGFLKDIGSLKEAELTARNAEEQANAANMAKSRFLATMSHEIRTPLNGVLGMASALETSGLTVDQRAMLAIVQSSGEDLLALLNDLLDMAKVESGTVELNESSFYLPDLVQRVAALFTDSARARHTELNVAIAPSARVQVKGDAMRIRQILNNLISNALKFTDDGEITVSVERAPIQGKAAQTVIKVADTGIGIAADDLERVFEPFVQIDPSLNRRYEGTGLGLAICRRLAERMGGTINVCSQPGRGSIFLVALPLAEVEADATEPAEAAREAHGRGDLGALRVLVAEDNRKNQIVIEKVLSTTGVEIIFAADGKEALARWRENEVDLVLMDVRMPVADGLWASREIRQLEQSEGRPRTPIIALSADATAEGVLDALGAGMDAHISKPIQVRPLLETIASVIRRPTA